MDIKPLTLWFTTDICHNIGLLIMSWERLRGVWLSERELVLWNMYNGWWESV